jgi:hypothetical protein
MIKFKIEDKEYIVPEFISIDHYIKIFKIKDLFSDDYFAAKLLNIVTGAPVEDLLESDYQEVEYLAAYVMSLLPIEKKQPFIDRFQIDGVHYGFFPNWKDLSFAEYVDMDTISTKQPDELLQMLHILAAVMYRPIVQEKSEHDFKIEKYDVESMQERSELFNKKLDIKVILGAQFFFIKFANRFSGYTQLSLIPNLSIWTKIKLLWKLRRLIMRSLSKKHSAGSLSSTELLETILRNTSTSIKRSSSKS